MDFLSCGWDNAKFLIFSDNVFDPLIYYSHLGPITLAVVLGIFVFFGNRKELLSKILLSLILFFCVWNFFDLILWASEKSEIIMFVWSSMIFFDLLMYATAFYFIYVFIHKKDLSLLYKIAVAMTFIPLLVLSFTQYNLAFFDLTNCDREALEGILWDYTYVVEILFVILIVIDAAIGLYRSKKGSRKNMYFVVSGIVLFLLAFSWSNIAGSLTEDWSIGQYGIFGMPVFIGFLTYSIVKFKMFDIKLLGAQALVATLVVLIGAQFFFIQNNINRILTGITLALVTVFGWMLIRSVKAEVKRKDELQKISNALAIANQRLKELDATKSEFISIASHQLRTPLTAIKGYISLLLEGSYGVVSSEVLDILNKLYSVNNRLVHLVEDLLNVSRIEAGRIQYSFAPTQLEPIITELVDMFRPTAKDKKLTLEMKLLKNPLPLLTIDPNKIKEVLSNLIDNSLKYTVQGGVTVLLESTSSVARIIVSDTGIGIKPEDKGRLFEKFIRTSETTKMVASGAGLGLYVGKSFIEAHGGKIWAESDGEGKGSRFIIELPFKNEKIHIGTSDQPTIVEPAKN